MTRLIILINGFSPRFGALVAGAELKTYGDGKPISDADKAALVESGSAELRDDTDEGGNHFAGDDDPEDKPATTPKPTSVKPVESEKNNG